MKTVVETVKQGLEYAKSRAGKRQGTVRCIKVQFGNFWGAPQLRFWMDGQTPTEVGYYSADGMRAAKSVNGVWVWNGWCDMPAAEQEAWLQKVTEATK